MELNMQNSCLGLGRDLAHGANTESHLLDPSLPLKHLFRTSEEPQR